MHRLYPPPPPPLKLSHRYATEVDFQIYEMGPLAYYMADDFFIPNPSLATAPLFHTVYWLALTSAELKSSGHEKIAKFYPKNVLQVFPAISDDGVPDDVNNAQ